MKLNLGCGRDARSGWVNLDREPLPGVDCVFDLERCGGWPVSTDTVLPFDDNTFEEIEASHILEHIRNLLPLAQELHRVAKPGGLLRVRCPYGSSDDAWEDPQHVRTFFVNSFGYLSQPFYWRADYGYRGDWQPKTITLILRQNGANVGRTAQELLAKVHRYRNVVQEMIAELEAIKPIRPPKRELQTPPQVRLGL